MFRVFGGSEMKNGSNFGFVTAAGTFSVVAFI
jgi:hypothetical protein